jgi:adenylate kinase
VGVRLVVFGRQGAGKGTQCKLLAAHYGAPHISTGDMLREAAASGSDFGRQAKEIMDRGELMPDEIMLGIIKERFGATDVVDHGFLLDGFPRTLAQAEALLAQTAIDVAVNIEVPEQVVIDRISSRRVCANGHTYAAGDDAIAGGTCPEDGTEVVQRADDTTDAVAARLATYAAQTLPAVHHLDEAGLLVTVDGLGTPEDVSARLIAAIDERIGR